MKTKLSESEARQYSPLALAFLGDGVYELQVRTALLARANEPVDKLHREKVQYVCAEFQAKAAERLAYTPAEQAVYRRGVNAAVHAPKSATPAAYRKATGFEAVFGYLHLMGDEARVRALFSEVWAMREEVSRMAEKEGE